MFEQSGDRVVNTYSINKIMIRFLIILVAMFLPAGLLSQENQIIQDPAAGQILERVAAKTKSMKSMQSDFELVIEDRKEKTRNSSAGNLVIKQNKYKINSKESVVFFNGTTMWTFSPSHNEVTVTEPGVHTDDFMSNPADFFSFYKRDFKYRYVGETLVNGSNCHEIDLFPKNLNQPYSRIKVFVGVKTDLPEKISSIGKDGVDYTVNLKNLLLNQEIDDNVFTFDPTKYKKVEVVDMRGLN